MAGPHNLQLSSRISNMKSVYTLLPSARDYLALTSIKAVDRSCVWLGMLKAGVKELATTANKQPRSLVSSTGKPKSVGMALTLLWIAAWRLCPSILG